MNFEMVMQLRMKGSLAIWLIRKKKKNTTTEKVSTNFNRQT